MASLAHLVPFKKPVAIGCNRFFNTPDWGNSNWQLQKTRKTATDGLVFFQFSSVQFSCSFFAVTSTGPEDTSHTQSCIFLMLTSTPILPI
jgi:hypothetical protein